MVMASAGAAQPWSKQPIGVVGGWGKKADVDEQLNNLPVLHCKLAEDKLLQCKLAVPEVEGLGTDAVLSAAVDSLLGIRWSR